jgi:hypothetical protein
MKRSATKIEDQTERAVSALLTCPRVEDVAALVRRRLLPELYAGLTRNTSAVLALQIRLARYGDLCTMRN